MMKNYKSLVAIGCAAMLAVTGCSKDEETLLLEGKSDEEKQAIAIEIAKEQYAMTAGVASGMSFADEGMSSAEGGRVNEECYTLTYNMSNTELRYRIDFGDGCVTPENQVVKGAIEIVLGMDISADDIAITYTYEFQDYEVDEHVFSGRVVVSGYKYSLDFELIAPDVISLSMIDTKHTYPDGTHFLLNREWTIEEDDANPLITLVNGNSSGKTRLGLTFSAEIDEALQVNDTCEFEGMPLAGIWNASVSELGDVSVDYGNGTCDDVVTLTYNGNTYTVDIDE